MRFVDGKECERRAFEQFAEMRLARAFGRDVEQVERARAETLDRLSAIGVGAGQRCRADAVGGGGSQLVVHQRDQRRDDDAGSFEHDGGKLIGQRLARAGGHDGQRRLPGEHAPDHGFLHAAKGGKPKTRESVSRAAERSLTATDITRPAMPATGQVRQRYHAIPARRRRTIGTVSMVLATAINSMAVKVSAVMICLSNRTLTKMIMISALVWSIQPITLASPLAQPSRRPAGERPQACLRSGRRGTARRAENRKRAFSIKALSPFRLEPGRKEEHRHHCQQQEFAQGVAAGHVEMVAIEHGPARNAPTMK
jgi:hypothetical protein